jgi:hypothetical protein
MKICQLSIKEDFPLEWQGEHPVLCVAGRSLIDEAAAIMLASHGLAARVEAAEVLYTANLFRLETTGVAIVCLVYMGAGGPAHMRYSVRRLRRKLPKAIINVPGRRRRRKGGRVIPNHVHMGKSALRKHEWQPQRIN